MACGQVHDSPAVSVALEHIKELDKELKDEGVAFSLDASTHLFAIIAAIQGLDAERRAAHEHLEVASIENSTLRHDISNTREQMSAIIVADVEAARAANAQEIQRLREDLHVVSQIQEETMKKHEEVAYANELRSIELEELKAKHQEVIAALNNERTQMYELQSHMGETKENTDKLEASIASYELDTSRLQEDLASEREAFEKSRDELLKDIAKIEEMIKCQEQVILRSRKQLETLSKSKRDGNESLDGLQVQTVQVESSIQRLQVSKSRSEKKLKAEKEMCKELMTQKEALEKQLNRLSMDFNKTVTRLKEEIAAIEVKIVGAKKVKISIKGALDKASEAFKVHNEEEAKVRTEYDYVSGELEKSKVKLDDRIACIVRHKKESEEMEKQTKALTEEEFVKKKIFDREEEELCNKMNMDKQQAEAFENEKMHLLELLLENKRTQEEHVKAMTAKIKATQGKMKEQQTEESALKKKQPMTPDKIQSYMKKSQAQYEQIVCVCQEAIQRCSNEIANWRKTCEEKQEQVAEKEDVLKAAEAEWKEEMDRYSRLHNQETAFKMKKCDLEKTIEELEKATVLLLEPKEKLKAELESLRAGHMVQLRNQATELKSVEKSIYDSSVKLEQVKVENSRLHLRINQMRQDMSKAKEDKERYEEETEETREDTEGLFRSLQEAWKDEQLLTQKRNSVDAPLMAPLDELQRDLRMKGQHLGHVQTMLHKQMLDFSRRLGDKITVEPQS